MKTDHLGIWIRCWDGSEMEYERWTHKEMKRMVKKGYSDYIICHFMQCIPELKLGKYLDDLRGGILG